MKKIYFRVTFIAEGKFYESIVGVEDKGYPELINYKADLIKLLSDEIYVLEENIRITQFWFMGDEVMFINI